jgi:hypothetical protein
MPIGNQYLVDEKLAISAGEGGDIKEKAPENNLIMKHVCRSCLTSWKQEGIQEVLAFASCVTSHHIRQFNFFVRVTMRDRGSHYKIHLNTSQQQSRFSSQSWERNRKL